MQYVSASTVYGIARGGVEQASGPLCMQQGVGTGLRRSFVWQAFVLGAESTAWLAPGWEMQAARARCEPGAWGSASGK